MDALEETTDRSTNFFGDCLWQRLVNQQLFQRTSVQSAIVNDHDMGFFVEEMDVGNGDNIVITVQLADKS
jgi:hypothetical protein